MNRGLKGWLIAAAAICSLSAAALVFASEPGSNEDPLVTKSYIDNAIAQLKEYVDNTVGGNASGGETAVSEGFAVIRLAEGQKIIFGSSAEFIVRMGTGSVISSEKGGIADVTAGADVASGDKTSANHHMIVPLDDGRGFSADDSVIVMVKGKYSIN